MRRQMPRPLHWLVCLLSACAPAAAPAHSSSAVDGRRLPLETFQAEFSAFRARAEGRPFPEQLEAWDALIERPHRAFYDDVVWEHARGEPRGAVNDAALEQRFGTYATRFDDIEAGFKAFSARAPARISRFRALFPDFPGDLPVVAMVGPRFDAKGALLGGRVVLAFAVDTLVLEDANLDIVFPHELLHAYHARTRGFLNDGVMPSAPLAIPLWEEGLATYVSSLMMPAASDGELLLDPALGRVSAEDVRWLATSFAQQASERVLAPTPTEAFKRWFSVSPVRARDDLPNRCGYLLGLHVVRTLAEHHSLREMVEWTPAEADGRVRSALADVGR